ncbi:hypothetical protein ATY35_19590 [Vibrio cidicii]|uniref:HTH araC/xylS-type domain-containing protein n=1 Tax=Vibrio cidicii TaxID=1763883 RepID=A0A151KVK9_9VIBR|nr:helix-turn-helix domain-containing protein [Vibrio cidicii]EJN6829951.1 helix-turn-helix domain-containing protein [Vibrio cidicii]KYN82462.1 hypothetical protein ATY35_19590 [Vibrio cidicii]KYN86735.1 hypothetical protein ATY37_04175 [Vibrio cidicii]MBG0757686.1 hypothetical protein [Vibrio cidicii]MBG0761889.1 hypothetical protein [Vibrio cidicii]
MSGKIVVYCSQDVNLGDVSTILEVFDQSAKYESSFKVELVSDSGGMVKTNLSTEIETIDISKILIKSDDIVFVVGGGAILENVPRKTKLCLSEYYDLGCKFCCINTGVFILAQCIPHVEFCGTTHWSYSTCSSQASPNLTAQFKNTYCIDDKIWSCAGRATTYDLCIQLLRHVVSSKTAACVARELLLPAVRNQEESQISMAIELQVTAECGKWSEIVGWIRSNISRQITVDLLADHMAMSPRNFTRKCNEYFQLSPKKLVDKVRLSVAIELIENTSYSLEYIAYRCGYFRSENMKRAFVKYGYTVPSDLRKKSAA